MNFIFTTEKDNVGRVLSASSSSTPASPASAPPTSIDFLSFSPSSATPQSNRSVHRGQTTPISYGRYEFQSPSKGQQPSTTLIELSGTNILPPIQDSENEASINPASSSSTTLATLPETSIISGSPSVSHGVDENRSLSDPSNPSNSTETVVPSPENRRAKRRNTNDYPFSKRIHNILSHKNNNLVHEIHDDETSRSHSTENTPLLGLPLDASNSYSSFTDSRRHLGTVSPLQEDAHDAENVNEHDVHKGDFDLLQDIISDDEVREAPDLQSIRIYHAFFAALGLLQERIAIKRKGMVVVPVGNIDKYLIFRYLHTSVYLAFALWYTVVNVNSSIVVEVVWLKSLLSMLTFIAAMISLWMGSHLLTARKLPTRVFYCIRNTTHKTDVRNEVNVSIYTSIAVCLILAAIGSAADLISSHHVIDAELNKDFSKADGIPASGSLLQITGLIGVYLYDLSAILVNLLLMAGIALYGTLCNIHIVRIRSCARALQRDSTTTEAATINIFDIDVSLSDFSNEVSVAVCTIAVCEFLTFFFRAVFIVSQTELTSPWDLLTLFQPVFICLYILITTGLVNKHCDLMKYVCVRYIIYQRRRAFRLPNKAPQFPSAISASNSFPSSPSSKESHWSSWSRAAVTRQEEQIRQELLNPSTAATDKVDHLDKDEVQRRKDLNEYIKTGDFSLRLSGFKVELTTAWTFFVLLCSSLFTLLHLETFHFF